MSPGAHLRRPHHHDGLRADPHVPAHRGQAVRADGGDDLAGRDRLAPAHADADPRAGHPPVPPAAGRARKPAAGLAAPTVRLGPPPVPAPAAAPDRRRRRAADRRADRVRGPRQGVPARARRGRPVGAGQVPDRHLARGGAPVRARDPRTPRPLPRDPGGGVPARRPRRRHRSQRARQRRVLRGAPPACAVALPGQGSPHRCHGRLARGHPGHHHQLLAADQGQRGRGPGRRQRRAGHQALRAGRVRAGGHRPGDRRRAARHTRRDRPRLRSPGGPAAGAVRDRSQRDGALRHHRAGRPGCDRGRHQRPDRLPDLRGRAPLRPDSAPGLGG